MKHTVKLFALILGMAMLLSACAPVVTPAAAPQAATTNIPAFPTATAAPTPAATTATTPSVAISNPASKYCVDQGFKSEIRTVADGSQYGVCKFPNRSGCEEWAYFQGGCKAGQYSVAPTPAITPAKP